MIDIFAVEPSVIDKSLSGKTLLLAGAPKIGKSEFCATSPRTLILDMENGYNAHPGVLKVQITKWSDLKLVVRQLERPEAHEKYDNIAIDTINEAWDLCTTFICQQNGVQKIKDIPYGAGYKDRDNEFAEVLRKIINLNFGVILTCHTKEKTIATDGDIDITSLAPDLDKRCLPIVNGLVDIIGVIQQIWNNGVSERWLMTKATPTITAGSRWKNLDAKIPFGYSYLEEAIDRAISQSVDEGAIAVDKVASVTEVIDFIDTRNEAFELWKKLVGEGENINEDMARTILKKAEIIFGHPVKLSEVTEDQKELMFLVVVEMRSLLNS